MARAAPADDIAQGDREGAGVVTFAPRAATPVAASRHHNPPRVTLYGAKRDDAAACALPPRSGRRNGLVFGRSETLPFAHVTLRERAHRAWKEAGFEPIGLHEGRHTFASMCIAAGVNARGLMGYLGHSSIQMTFDRYAT